MITVHHLNHSRSQRVLWLLEELGTPYQVKHYQRDAKTMLAPATLRAIHPLGKSPVITDGDKTIAETGAIVEYLIETYGGGRLIPANGSAELLRHRYWMHYAEGSAMPPLVMKLIFSHMPEAPGLPFFLRPVARMITQGVIKSYIDPQLKTHIAFWDEALTHTGWFAGDGLTGADIMMSFPLEAAASRSVLPQRIAAYLTKIHDRTAYKAALERGGPYQLMS